jgi:hypothetical protein
VRIPDDPGDRETLRRAVERRAVAESAVDRELGRRARLLAATDRLSLQAGRRRRLAAAIAGSRLGAALARTSADFPDGDRVTGVAPDDWPELSSERARGGGALRQATELRRGNYRLARRQRALEHGAVHLLRSIARVFGRARERSTPGADWRPIAMPPLRVPIPAATAARRSDVSVVVVGRPTAVLRAALQLIRSSARPRELLLVPTAGRTFGPSAAEAARQARCELVVVADAHRTDAQDVQLLVAPLVLDHDLSAVATAATRFDWSSASPEPVTEPAPSCAALLGGPCAAFRRDLLAAHRPCPEYGGELWLADLSLEANAHGHRLAVVRGAAPKVGAAPTAHADLALLRGRWGPALRARILDDLLAGGGELCRRRARVLVEPGCPPAVVTAVDQLAFARVTRDRSADVVIGTAEGRLTFDWLLRGERAPAASTIAEDDAGPIDPTELHEALAASAARGAFCIQIGSPGWEAANAGGDAPLARSLARALGRRGHTTLVQVDSEAGSPGGQCLDVLLTLRGRAAVDPTTPGRLNLLWLISHPSEVDPRELDRYDRVLVASRRYVSELQRRARPTVEPLLQFTDPELFHPDPDPEARHELAFVGNWRSVLRPVVWDALATGRPLALYGRGWDRIAPEHTVAEHVPHGDLRRVYSSTDILLCDHWDDMREHGFLSNRVFDALACRTFVIADDNAAIADELAGAVETYADAGDLAAKLDRYLSSPDARAEAAQLGRALVMERHTVDRRALELLGAAGAAARDCTRTAVRHTETALSTNAGVMSR